jgi:hypothetical protein
VSKLDAFLQFNEYEVPSTGAEVAKRLAEEQFDGFHVRQDRVFESDLEIDVKRIGSKRTSRRKKRDRVPPAREAIYEGIRGGKNEAVGR